MPDFDVLIRNGMIVDGALNPRYLGDVAIRDGIVVQLGRVRGSATRELDATGLVVAPGFVDLHTHYDAQVFWDPYCSLSGWHGVTSVAIGNCGFGFAPVRAADREQAMRTLTRVEAIPLESMRAGLPWSWETFAGFLDALERTPKAVNLLPYVPVNPLLTWVLGHERAKAGVLPTDDEHATMARLLDDAMEAGAFGWSAQRLQPSFERSVQRDHDGTPMPSDVMHDETCRVLARVLADRNEGVIQMTLVSGDPKADGRHYEELAEISGAPVLYNVVVADDRRPAMHRGTLKWLEGCQRRGLRVYGQGQTTDAGYTFTFEDWNLYDDAGAWREATVGTVAERLAKLADPARRAALQADQPSSVTAPIPEIVVVRSESMPDAEGRTIGELADRAGVHPVDAMLDLAVADGLRTVFYGSPPNANVENLREILANRWVLFGVSDGGAHTKFVTSGRYPTETLVQVVREHEIVDLEEAHWRLSALPARFAGFRDRGVLREGAPADIVVYDFDNLAVLPMEVACDFPGGEWRRIQRARGYRYVLVNGAITIEDDRETSIYGGELLRHGGVGARVAVT